MFSVDWLDRALHGQETLPKVAPDESPATSLLRLGKVANSWGPSIVDLLILVTKFPKTIDSSFVELLRLASGLGLAEVVEPLMSFVLDTARWDQINRAQQSVVLSTLIDLGAKPPIYFWLHVVHRDNRFAPLVFVPLLRQNTQAAMSLLVTMPDKEAVADRVFLALQQHGDTLSAEELDVLKRSVVDVVFFCPDLIMSVLQEWYEQVA